ncbi:efflux RND transporter periplasmic adaptor subunit [Clostridium sp. MSJ-11]|uniref:Efflux RND transporter periplasmic adaptor subunit n=1 Tax=Clostridium mobile TaxID=2841512 RepID=A0ABS6EN59_9CLOT|nr:efflux RND transporter periplasmic adaptor subunit [Clostridium mobile]MBU5486202.1 efflux RND transporter periplasmic adaptor subunit [Clostridium mobile]
MKKKNFVWIISIFIIVLIISFFYMRKMGKKPISVKTAIVQEGEIKSYLSTTGIIKSKNSKEYYANQGKIQKLYVKLGDKVKKGQTLVEFDVPNVDDSIRQAEIQYENALLQKKDLMRQRDNIEENKKKLDEKIHELESSKNPNSLSQLQTLKQQRESIQNISNEKLKQSENAVALAEIVLDSTRKKKDEIKSKIIADFDGVITAINGADGAIYNGMQPVIVVEDVNNLKVIISLSKYDAAKIKVGQMAIVKNGNKNYNGKVTFMEPVAKKPTSPMEGEKTLDATVDIVDKVEDLKINFDVDIDILTGKVDKTIKIPTECIKNEKGGRNIVYIVSEDRAIEREVKTGFQSDMEVQILEGLTLGDKVILNPSTNIINGTLVKES